MRATSTCTIEQAPRADSRETARAVKALADRDRNSWIAQPDMAFDVVGGQRLLEPPDVGGFVKARAADRLVDCEGLVGVGEDLECRPTRRGQPSRSTSSWTGRPTLTFEPPKPSLARNASSTSAPAEMQPPALGRVEADPILRAARHEYSGRPALRQRRSHNAVSIAASAREVMAPTEVAWVRNSRSRQIFSTRPRRGRSRRAQASARSIRRSRVRPFRSYSCSRADRAVAVGDANERRFLTDEGLNGVDALHLRLQIDHRISTRSIWPPPFRPPLRRRQD